MPKDEWSKEINEKYQIPIYSNGVDEKALYGYTNITRVFEDALTISGRGTIGYVAIRKAPFFPIVRLIVVVPNKDIVLLPYLYYILKGKDIQSMATGGTIPQLTVPILRELEVEIPDLATQEKIVAEVSEIEAKIAELQTQMAGTEEKKKAVLERFLS